MFHIFIANYFFSKKIREHTLPPSLKSSTYMAGALPNLKSSTYMAGTLPKIVSLSIIIICFYTENINNIIRKSSKI